MGTRMPEIRWAVFKRQVINLRICCIWLVDSVESMMMHGLANPKQLPSFRRNVTSPKRRELYSSRHNPHVPEDQKTQSPIYFKPQMKTQTESALLKCRGVLCESRVLPRYGVQYIASLTLLRASALWRMVAIISNYATSTSGGNMAAAWFISPSKQTSLPKRFPPSIPGTLWPIKTLSDLQVLLPHLPLCEGRFCVHYHSNKMHYIV